MTNSSPNPEVILRQFKTQEFPPVLDEASVTVLRGFFRAANMEQVFGSVPLSVEEPSTIELLLSHDTQADRILKDEAAVIGPCLYGDKYVAHGVGIWKPISTNA